jgi:hypothetical protein
MTSKQAAEAALNLEGVTVKDHFGGDAFSANKRQFLTLWHEKNQGVLKFSQEQQLKFLQVDGDAFSEINDGWGRQGWTRVHFAFIEKKDFLTALQVAYDNSAVKVSKLKTVQKKITPKKSKSKKKVTQK